MFYLIEFDNIESEKTKKLMFELAGYPNGTILSFSQQIRVTNLSKDKRIVWIDKDIIDRRYDSYINFSKIEGIKAFIELNIEKSIYDSDWIYDDNYINNVFKDIV